MIMNEKSVNQIIDKIMQERYDEDDPSLKRQDARSGARTGKEERPQTYEDWVKSQPQTGMPIGIHKRKKK